MKNQKICIVSFSNIAWDSRVLREIHAAAQHYQVDVIGFGDWQPPEGVRFFSVPKTKRDVRYLASYVSLLVAGRLYARAWDSCFWQKKEYRLAQDILRNGNYDLIHANDWDALPVAVSAVHGQKTRVLFDAHEYSVEQGVDASLVRLRVPFREYLLRTYGGSVTKMITVGNGIRDLYHEHFGWESEVIMNSPAYVENQFRAVDPMRIHLVHHGGAIPGRYIEDMIAMMPLLDKRYHLNLMLMPTDRDYFGSLKEMAQQSCADRVTFWEPVAPFEIVRELVKFDIGIPLMRVGTKSYYHALPNKFFEYTMAGLGIAVSPLPDMQKYVAEWQTGVVAPDQSWRSMADALNSLSPEQIDQFKRNSLSLAKVLNADVEMEKLMQLYEKLLNG